MSKTRTRLLRFVVVLALFASVTGLHAQDAKKVVADAAKAIGADTLKTVRYAGTGFIYTFEQNYKVTDPWPKFTLKQYTRVIDFDKNAGQEQALWTAFDGPGGGFGGGFYPLKGDLGQNAFVSGNAAWNVAPNGNAAPQLALVSERQMFQTLTPHGFLKAAMAGNPAVAAKTVNGKKMNVVTITVQGKYKVNGYINGQNEVEKIETWMPDPFLGDMLIDASFSDYRDFSGVKFPMKMQYRKFSYPILDLTVNEVVPNAPVNIQVPMNVQNAKIQPITFVSEKLGDGLWLMRGGIQSLGVEFKDYTVIVDIGPDEERSEAVIAEMKRLVPNKPVKYVVNTHHHLDHTGGLRTFVAEGATIITGAPNKGYYERLLKLPYTLEPDRLAKNPRPAKFIEVKDKYVLTDGDRSLEFYILRNGTHDPGNLMTYVPKEKMAIAGDTVAGPVPLPPAGSPLPANINNIGLAKNMIENVDRLKLDVKTYVPNHGMGTITAEDMKKGVEVQDELVRRWDAARGSN